MFGSILLLVALVGVVSLVFGIAIKSDTVKSFGLGAICLPLAIKLVGILISLIGIGLSMLFTIPGLIIVAIVAWNWKKIYSKLLG